MFYYDPQELNVSRNCLQESVPERKYPDWPPSSAAEMVLWQRQVGTDLEIARHLGLSRASVYGQRTKFGIPALPRKKRGRVREKQPGARMTRHQIARLYAGRQYENRLSAPPLRGLRSPLPGLRETAPSPYSIAAE